MVFDFNSVSNQAISQGNFILVIVVLLTVFLVTLLLLKAREKYIFKGLLYGAVIMPIMFWISSAISSYGDILLVAFAFSGYAFVGIFFLTITLLVVGGILGLIIGAIFNRLRKSTD